METNRIKWNEEMNSRCIKRADYFHTNNISDTAKRKDTLRRERVSRHGYPISNNVHAIGVGEIMECQVAGVPQISIY